MRRAIYLAGLGQEMYPMSLRDYAQRLSKALDEEDPVASNAYKAEISEMEYSQEGLSVDVVTISKSSEQDEKIVYKLYNFDYAQFLTSNYSDANILKRFLVLCLVLLARFPSLMKSFFDFNFHIKKRSKIQASYFLIIYAVLGMYLLFLIPSVLSVLNGMMDQSGDTVNNSWFGEFLNWIEPVASGIVTSFAVTMMLSPASKTIFAKTAIEYLGANQYLSTGEQRQKIQGKLSKLIEEIIEKEGEDIKIELHGYSFGSVIAFDALFPKESPPSTRIKNCITSFCTIGFPLDYIEIYWDNYFSNRVYDGLSLVDWKNIWSETDVLSSSLDNDKTKKLSLIKDEQFWETLSFREYSYNIFDSNSVGYLELFMFYGIRAHSMYWDRHSDSKSCLVYLAKNDY